MVEETPNISSFVSATYDETVALIEETAKYLVDRSSADQKAIPDAAAAAFAGENIRLTTRLMQVMAWLLNQRAVQSGELTIEDARKPTRRLGNIKVCLAPPFKGAHLLPLKLQDMLERSEDLFRRVLRLDKLLLSAPDDNPVHGIIQDIKVGINERATKKP